MRPLVDALFSELTVLGFMGLVALFLEKGRVFEYVGARSTSDREYAFGCPAESSRRELLPASWVPAASGVCAPHDVVLFLFLSYDERCFLESLAACLLVVGDVRRPGVKCLLSAFAASRRGSTTPQLVVGTRTLRALRAGFALPPWTHVPRKPRAAPVDLVRWR